jgi:hypothetical protein
MLTEAYIEALLVDEELADLVWEWWDVGLIDDELATIAWLLIPISFAKRPCRRDQNHLAYLCPVSPDREF